MESLIGLEENFPNESDLQELRLAGNNGGKELEVVEIENGDDGRFISKGVLRLYPKSEKSTLWSLDGVRMAKLGVNYEKRWEIMRFVQ